MTMYICRRSPLLLDGTDGCPPETCKHYWPHERKYINCEISCGDCEDSKCIPAPPLNRFNEPLGTCKRCGKPRYLALGLCSACYNDAEAVAAHCGYHKHEREDEAERLAENERAVWGLDQ